jgi:hypothetical protein
MNYQRLKEEILSIAGGLMIAADLHRNDTQKKYTDKDMMRTKESIQVLIDRLEFTARELVEAVEKVQKEAEGY